MSFPQKGWYHQLPSAYNDVFMFNGEVGFACGPFSSVAKTTDGGQSWQGLYTGITVTNSSILNSIYFTTLANGWAVGNSNTIIKTTNGGDTWFHQFNGYPIAANETVTLNDVYFVDSQTGWCAGYSFRNSVITGLIFKTTNGGETWTYLTYPVLLKSVKFISPTQGWAVGSQGMILHTTDGGGTWTQQTSGVTQNLFCVDFSDAQNGLAAGIGTILNTSNGGATWTKRVTGVSDQYISVQMMGAGVCFAMSYGKFFYSANNGDTWAERSSQLDQGTSYGMHFITTTIGWRASWRGMWKTTDGGFNWTPVMPQNALRKIFALDTPRKVWAAGDSGYVVKSDNGRNWKYIKSGVSIRPYDIFFRNELTGWVVGGYEPNLMMKTTDGGSTWAKQNINARYYLYSIHFPDAQNGWTVGQVGQIYRTLDSGKTWSVQINPKAVNLYAVRFANSQVGYAGGEGGTMLKTTNGGLLWDTLQTNSGDPIYRIFCIGTEIVIAWSPTGKLIKSANGGSNWTGFNPFTSGLNDFDLVNEQMGWAVENYKFWRTTTGGQTYSQQWEFGADAIDMLNENTGWAVYGNTIFHTENGGLSESEGSEISPLSPENIYLEQNYPNPFNPTTTIRYQLFLPSGEMQNVKMAVYDILGREIATLVNEPKSGGIYQVKFNSSGLPSGVYMYRLEAGGKNLCREMILLK